MHVSKAARRYANALLELGKELDSVEAIFNDVALIDNTIEGSNELSLFLKSPIIKLSDKEEALKTLFGDKIEDATSQFLSLMATKGRLDILSEVTKGFFQLYNSYAGILEVDVVTAAPLSPQQEQLLKEKLHAHTGKEIELSIREDASLKGGLAIRIGDTVIDGTIKHKLQELEDQLTATAVQ